MFKKLTVFGLILLCFLCLVSCGSKNNEPDGIKVVYELNGGVFQNCTLPIKQYYKFDEDTKKLIKSPEVLSGSSIIKTGYTLEGWYKDSEFKNKWDFAKDEVPVDGITLYAKWNKDIKFTYVVCYYDESNNIIELGTYEVKAGEVFEDWRGFSDNRKNYTPIKFLDENGNLWNEEFTHPGGDKDVAVNVFVEYIEGEFELVSTAKELKNARTKNIYLLNDIDFEGEEFSFSSYGKIFKGNGYKVKNFKVNVIGNKTSGVDDHLDSSIKAIYGSIFGNLKNAVVEDVMFENVEFVIDIGYDLISKVYINPLCVNMNNSIVKNVSISATYSISKLPNNFDLDNIVILNEDHIISKDESSTENINIVINKKGEN